MAALWLLLIGVLFHAGAADQEFIAKLKNANVVIQESMDSILQEWNVSLYPNFLKSASASRHSFDYMKHKVGVRCTSLIFA
jgi:hypothetical protein